MISAVGTATYNASKFLAEVIGPLVSNRGHTGKNSEEIIANVASMDIALEEVMINFDVEALCTSSLIGGELKYTQSRLESDNMLGKRISLNVDPSAFGVLSAANFLFIPRRVLPPYRQIGNGITDFISCCESVHGRTRNRQ